MRLDPPLLPGADDGRGQLRRELLEPAYHRQDVLRQVLDWVQRRVQSGLSAAHDAPPLSTLAGMAVLLLLVAALLALVSRARRTATSAGTDRAVLTAEIVTAAELRARAWAAHAAGRFEDAVVDGFRALTLQQVEQGTLPDAPGATAHEVALAIGADWPAVVDRVTLAADRFDAVRYGSRPADDSEAREVLTLDADLSTRHGVRRGALR